MSAQDYENTIAKLDERIEELEAENAKMKAILQKLHTPGSIVATQNAELEKKNAKMRELAQAVIDEQERLSTYIGGPVAIDELNKRIRALAEMTK